MGEGLKVQGPESIGLAREPEGSIRPADRLPEEKGEGESRSLGALGTLGLLETLVSIGGGPFNRTEIISMARNLPLMDLSKLLGRYG